jgi:hypothetical protein
MPTEPTGPSWAKAGAAAKAAMAEVTRRRDFILVFLACRGRIRRDGSPGYQRRHKRGYYKHVTNQRHTQFVAERPRIVAEE